MSIGKSTTRSALASSTFAKSIDIGFDFTKLINDTLTPSLFPSDSLFYSATGNDDPRAFRAAAPTKFDVSNNMPTPAGAEHGHPVADQKFVASNPVTGVGRSGGVTASPITVADGAVVEINGASGQSVTFAGATGTLKLDDSLVFTGQVSGLTGSDALDLADVHYGASTTATFLGNTNGGTLTVTDGTHTANIVLQGDYLSSSWTLSSDGKGGTLVVDPVASNNWQTLDVGAGGFVDGIDVAPDGTMVIRTDTYGAYIWNGTQWQQLVTSSSMPADWVTPNSNNQGVYEIQIAPSNSNIMYMMYEGHIFQSTNKGTTWTQTSFAPVSESTSDAYRMYGQKMAVDPENPNVVYVGTPQNGLFVTTDGGASWKSVSAVPISLSDGSGNYPGITGIEFDPALGTTAGKTNTIFAASAGNGVYESTNGGTSWSAIGGPGTVGSAAVSSTGVYYAVGNGNSLWSYNHGAWAQLLSNTSGQTIQTVAVNPVNPSEIVVQTAGGVLDVSYDGGKSWSGFDSNRQLSAADIPWLGNTATWMSIGGTVFNPLVPNELISSAGIGVWTTNIPTSGFTANTSVTWTSQSLGIEQLVANEIIVPPGGNPVLASWDRPFFYISDANAYPATYGPNTGSALTEGWSIDYASSNPSFLVGIADNWGLEQSGYSTNGGQTWTPFSTFIPGAGTNFVGGTIAASSSTNFIWAPAGGHDPYYTLDGGNTWNPITLPGVSNWNGFDFSAALDARTVTADRVLPNTFYLYYAGDWGGAPAYGLYETTNGGVTWKQMYSGEITPWSMFNAELQAVPGKAGNLFFTGGPQEGYPNEPFMFSTNSGATWTAVSNVTQVNCFGFGAPAPGQGYPSIYIVGYVNSVYGIWQSNDDAKSWVQIGTYPAGDLDQIKTIAGDPNAYGQVYVGFAGSGYAYLPAATSTVAPAAPTVTSFSPDSGTVGDGITNATVLTLTGTAAAGSTVTLFDGGKQIGTATANSSGAWNFTTATLVANVSHSFTATAADAAGNTSAVSAALNVTVDTLAPVAPTVTSFSPDSGTVGDGITNANQLTLTGSAAANSSVTLFDGAVKVGTAIANSSGVWSFTTGTLTNGTHNFTSTDTDTAGNTSVASVAIAVTVDTVAPNAPAITSEAIVGANEVLLAGTAEANSTVHIFDGTIQLGTATVNSTGAWNFTTGQLADGAHTFTATDTDVAGNTSLASLAVDPIIHTVDTAALAPALAPTFTNLVAGSHNRATLSGTSEANSVVSIYDGSSTNPIGTVTADANGTWSFTTAKLSNTVHNFTLTAVDAGGNVGTGTGVAYFGTTGNNTINLGPTSDIVTGHGGTDTFVFGTSLGNDIITDFQAYGRSHDVLQFSHDTFSSFAAVLAHAAQVGSDVVITADAADTVTLKSVQLSSLQKTDIHIV